MESFKVFITAGLISIILGTTLYFKPDLFPLPFTITRQTTIYDETGGFSRDSSNPTLVQANKYYSMNLYIYRLYVTEVFNNSIPNLLVEKEAEMRTYLENLVSELKTTSSIGLVTESRGWASSITLENSSISYEYGNWIIDKDNNLIQVYGIIRCTYLSDKFFVYGDPGTTFAFSYSITKVPDEFKVSLLTYCKVVDTSFDYKFYINDQEFPEYYYTNTLYLNIKVQVLNGSQYMKAGTFTIYDSNGNIVITQDLTNQTTSIWTCNVTLQKMEAYKYGLCVFAYITGATNPMRYFYNFGMIFPLTGQKLTILSSVGGTTYPSGECTYAYGQIATITASSESGYVFSYWIIDGVEDGSDNPISINMTSFYSLQAVFTYVGSDSVQVTVSLKGMGTCSPLTQGNYTLKKGTTVTLYAVPSTGYKFKCFIINGNTTVTSNPYTLTLATDTQIEVVFEKETVSQYFSYGLIILGVIMIAYGVKIKRKESVYY